MPQPKTHSVVHYRMALDRVGRKLTEFRSTCKLVTAIADAMEGSSILTRILFHVPMFCFLAHDRAYYDASILHRDISAGNIMILEGGGGFLIDWDMCVHVEEGAEPSRRVERTVGICLCSKIDLLLISVFIGNIAIHVGISPPE